MPSRLLGAFSLSLLLLVLPLLTGCSRNDGGEQDSSSSAKDEETATTSATSDETAATENDPESVENTNSEAKKADAAKVAEAEKKPLPTRNSVVGLWKLVLTQRGHDFPLLLFEIERKGDSYEAEVVDKFEQFEDVRIEKSDLAKNSVHLVLVSTEGTKYDLYGHLDKNVMWGNLLFEGGRCDPIRLMPTAERELGDVEPERTAHFNDMRDAVRADDPIQALADFARANPRVPLSLMAWEQCIAFAAREESSEKRTRALAKDYVQASQFWGDRMATVARVNIGLHLAQANHLVNVADEYIDAAEDGFDDSLRDSFAPLVAAARNSIEEAQRREEVVQAREAVIRGKDAEARAAGVATLERILREHPLDAVALYTLAQHAEREKQFDKALDYYGRLAVLPTMEVMLSSSLTSEDDLDAPFPSEAAARLWKEKHGDLEGFDAYLDDLYRDAIHAFAEEKATPQPQGNHTVLVELFTGSECPPCVAADVATGAIEKVFPQEQVVVLRYHEHIPAPDPLANPHSQQRFQMFGLSGTPTVLVDGEQISGVAGPLFMAPGGYRTLRSEIEDRVKQKSPVTLELSAKAADGNLDISAKAEGVGDEIENARLVLVIAEGEVPYHAGNGIRLHEMIVRNMPAGPEGVAAKDGKLVFGEQISLKKFKSDLTASLTDFEEEIDFEFREKPLDLDDLYLVAFVQDKQTGHVLQTKSIPVTGTLVYPEPETEAKPVESGKKDSPDESSSEKEDDSTQE